MQVQTTQKTTEKQSINNNRFNPLTPIHCCDNGRDSYKASCARPG